MMRLQIFLFYLFALVALNLNAQKENTNQLEHIEINMDKIESPNLDLTPIINNNIRLDSTLQKVYITSPRLNNPANINAEAIKIGTVNNNYINTVKISSSRLSQPKNIESKVIKTSDTLK